MCLLPSGVWAQSLTQRAKAFYMADNRDGVDYERDDDYALVLERLDAQVQAKNELGTLAVQARLDGFLFATDGELEGPLAQDSRMTLERLSANYRFKNAEIELGDQHLELGRGLALSLRPVEAAGVDVALRGGRAQVTIGDHSFMLFAGYSNSVDLDALSYKEIEQKDDLFVGGRYGLTLGSTAWSLYGVLLRPEDRLLDEQDRSATGGVSGEWTGEHGAVYAEFDYQNRKLAGLEDSGLAGYASLDLFLGKTEILLEGLWLDAFEQRGSENTALQSRFDYARGPSLERVDQEILETRDVRGGRLLLRRELFTPALQGYANAMYRLQKPGEPSEVVQLHFYGGLELEAAGEWKLSGGWRNETQQSETIKEMIHFEAATRHTWRRFELHSNHSLELRTLQGRDNTRATVFVGLDRARLGGVGFEFGYDDLNPAGDVRHAFYAGHVRYSLNQNHDFRLMAGTERGGLKCVSGVCREFPAFAGARLEWTARF